ncbi:MAG: bifunctional folylpolyglutamate synthase/dihydrofolate synthase, partial [Calditrichaeota bacterium]
VPDFVRIIARIQPMIEKYGATYFETLTAVALIYFAESAQISVLEVGLGGRLDATNIVVPAVSIITSISYDHTEHLGTTLAQIAAEKGGILKQGVPCVCGDLPDEASQVINAMAAERSVTIVRASNQYKAAITHESPGWTHFDVQGDTDLDGSYSLPLNGIHQVQNAVVAAAACSQLRQEGWKISRDSFAEGLKQTHWPGRFQIVGQNPTIIVDVAHNTASFDQLLHVLNHFFKSTKIFFIIGLLKDKDFQQIAKMVAGTASVVQPVTPDTPRALSAELLADQFAKRVSYVLKPGSVAEGIDAVLKIANPESTICIAGSHHVVGEALEKIKGLTR